MDIGLLVGLVPGLVGAAVGIWGVIFALGIFEYMGGKHPSNLPFISKEQLRQELLALNSPELPYQIRPASETDLLVEWKIVDAKWYVLYAKESLKEVYRGYLLLDEERRSVRYCEELGKVSWSAGANQNLVPQVHYQRAYLQGRILFQKSWGVGYGIKEDGTLGKVYSYYFDVGKVRDPMVNLVKSHGWEWVPVVRRGHATFPKSQTHDVTTNAGPQELPTYQWPLVHSAEPPVQKVNMAYWLLPLALTVFGGAVAYMLVRKKNPTTARNMLIFGILWFASIVIIPLIF